ncbi:uncharacterized protein [Acropora muricata]|uniref:uncharacterized protein isoform X2 n=1 Tax=Acropora muricata TaxID=159855 RepID=UPI0034E45B3D
MAWRRVFAILLLLIAFPATLCLGDEAEETASEADSSENEVVAEETVDESAKVDDEVKEEDDGLVLATKTFDSVVNDKDVTLVESNAPCSVKPCDGETTDGKTETSNNNGAKKKSKKGGEAVSLKCQNEVAGRPNNAGGGGGGRGGGGGDDEDNRKPHVPQSRCERDDQAFAGESGDDGGSNADDYKCEVKLAKKRKGIEDINIHGGDGNEDDGNQGETECSVPPFKFKRLIKEADFERSGLESWGFMSGKHDNILELYGAVKADGKIIVFMEYISGGSLEKAGKLDEGRALNIYSKILSGIEFMHSLGYIHRDISAANILIDDRGETAKLADFNLSIRLDNGYQQDDNPRGTVPFMAPEVCRSEMYSFSADIWSATCVLYRMLTGTPPWEQYHHCHRMTLLYQDEEPPTRDQSTQTLSNAELKSKIETLITSNALKTSKVVYKTISISSMSYENVIQDSQNMTHLTGLTSRQFKVLFDFLNDVCPLDKIRYWCHGKNSKQINSHKLSSQWSSEERLYICLLRLRRGFTIKTLSLLLSTPDKQIKDTSIREIFTTFIQLMYKVFRDMRRVMFPSKEVLQRFLPRVFKTIKRIRCTVDCTEFRVETSRNFARQGNTYSSYKHANTFKCLIAVTPNGGSCFVSDLYEGDISDVQIFEQSGILKHIEPQDVILVDRGFTVQDLVNPLQACIQIPAFLKGRGNLSAAEELSTRKIAKARVHVERFNQRLKQFKLVGRTIPLSLAPLATQMVVVACGLVNFQEVLCK